MKRRVVVDPHTIASVLSGGITRQRFFWLLQNLQRFEICYSETVIGEIEHLPTLRHFIKKGVTPEEVAGFLAFFQSVSLKVLVTSRVKLGRDVNDYYLLSLSRDARADFLITGDPDLLKIEKYSRTKILSMKQFVEMFQ